MQFGPSDERERFFCPVCGWIAYENPLPCSAAVVRDTDGGILLVLRGVDPGRGKWGLPSGFIEIDETPEQACLRELEEETGLKGNISHLLGVYAQESARYKNVVIIGYTVVASGRLSPGSDSDDAVFFPPDKLPEIAFSSHRAMIEDAVKDESP